MFKLREAAVGKGVCITLPTDPEELYKLTDMISIRTPESGTGIRGEIFSGCFAVCKNAPYQFSRGYKEYPYPVRRGFRTEDAKAR